jgi:hypothetical protein
MSLSVPMDGGALVAHFRHATAEDVRGLAFLQDREISAEVLTQLKEIEIGKGSQTRSPVPSEGEAVRSNQLRARRGPAASDRAAQTKGRKAQRQSGLMSPPVARRTARPRNLPLTTRRTQHRASRPATAGKSGAILGTGPGKAAATL